MGGGIYPNYGGPMGPNQYPPINPGAYPPMSNVGGPPVINPGIGSRPPYPPYNPVPYPNMNPMSMMPPSYYRPRPSYRRYSSHHSRPIVRIIEADCCSSISTCSSVSSCCSIDCPPQQQPIIILPIQYSQAPSTVVPLDVSSAPMIVQSLQPAAPLITRGIVQQTRAAPIQYVQASPKSKSSSHSDLTSFKTLSTFTPQRRLVTNIREQQSIVLKPIPRSATTQI